MDNERKGLKSLTMDELAGVINIYPWFGAARMELCERMVAMGGSDWGTEQFSEAAMYIPCRSKVFSLIRSSRRSDWSDKDLQNLLKEYIAPAAASPAVPVSRNMEEDEGLRMPDLPPVPGYHRTVRPAGGDFFSKDEYAAVKRDGDDIFSHVKAERSEENGTRAWEDPELGFCTETLAQIYAEQGYFLEAKKIYSRLILRYPEKSAYFASLIGNLQQEN